MLFRSEHRPYPRSLDRAAMVFHVASQVGDAALPIKQFILFRLNKNADFPRLTKTRKVIQDGSGKSTLTNAIMAHPNYEVTKGDIFFKGENINELRADERAKLGMFMSFQNPEEVPGVTVSNFIRASRMSITGEKESVIEFQRELEEKMESLTMDASYAQRYLNVGFSGGEKKKTEILQMVMLKPCLHGVQRIPIVHW